MKSQPLSSIVLALGGVILTGLGLYFVFMRPPLLPEDPRFIGTSLVEIQAAVPGLGNWLDKVFTVMGGYIFTTGLLTLYVALTAFRPRARGVAPVIALSGLTSIGLMVVVNFVIESDFRWLLLLLALPWAAALPLYALRR